MAESLDVLLRILLNRLLCREIDTAEAGVLASSKLDEISRAVVRLSDLYNRGRNELRQNLLEEPDLRLAYLAYFLPSNFLKINFILREIWRHPRVNNTSQAQVRILDLGCGPGTHLLGCLDFLSRQLRPPAKIECVAVDSLESNLKDTRHLFDLLSAELSTRSASHGAVPESGGASVGWTEANLETCRADVSRPLKLHATKSFDLIVAGNLLNELFVGEDQRIEKRARRIAAWIEDWMAPEGFLILLEPALRQTSRELLRVRDHLLAMLPLTVYSPCVHNRPCPAVGPGCASDWCHEDHTWEAPDWIRQIDRRTGLRKSSLKYSYVVLNRMGISIRDSATGAMQSNSELAGNQIWRVVSETLEERGKATVYLCGAQGRFPVTRLNKHGSQLNKDFGSLDRGQVVSTGTLVPKSARDLRVERETPVSILMGARASC